MASFEICEGCVGGVFTSLAFAGGNRGPYSELLLCSA
jgi:hypothetical protein